MKVTAVIGAQFGDEGKGLMTDYFSGPKSLVVRFNGGAQAGHTVVTPSGHRHAFHHFGAGTLRGAATYLSRFFICNPMLFAREYRTLEEFRPRVFIDPECLITTPYDMLLNEIVEKHRGDNRHGSCGCGINETIVRSESNPIRMSDYISIEDLREIAFEWVPYRLEQLQIKDYPKEYDKYFTSEDIMERYLSDFTLMERKSWMGCDHCKFEDVVFEGAQGLRLHQKHHSAENPHVTRSNTGMENVMEIAEELKVSDPIETVYVTRCYVTRHGRGPLPNECEKFKNVIDETNVYNEFQEDIRFAEFDLEDLINSIKADPGRLKSIAITCMDQMDYKVRMSDTVTCRKDHMIEAIKDCIEICSGYESWGPTRTYVSKTA